MFTRYRVLGFVFRDQEKFEADKIFTIFSEDYGTIKVLGRAIRKIKSKLRSGIDLFCLSEIEFIQGKNYKTLTDVQKKEEFSEIKKDLKKLKIAFRISEILNDFLKFEEKDKEIWNLILNSFSKLKSCSSEKSWLLFHYFLWNFFSSLGYKPNLYNCSLCDRKLKPNNLYFSSKEGGVICSSCSLKIKKKISPETVKILRIILKENWHILTKLKINSNLKRELRDISREYYFYLKER